MGLCYQEGVDKGLADGMKKGLEKGMEEGRKEGLEKGMKEGMEKGLCQVAIKMKQNGMDLATIMSCTGLDADTIAEL